MFSKPFLEVIRNEIATRGYFLWEKSFQELKREFSLEARNEAPYYLSKDFWSEQRSELVQNGWYVIRLGRGGFVILPKDEFPKPYLELSTVKATNIQLSAPASFDNLKRAYQSILAKKTSIENPLLEMLHFHGAYQRIVKESMGVDEYRVGPRGNLWSKFPVIFQRKSAIASQFTYYGQVELDYSIWTKDRILVIEAKSLSRGGLDIGWHKLALPAQRFAALSLEMGFDVSPAYLLRIKSRKTDVGFLYIFAPIRFHEGTGVVLNRSSDWKVEHVFSMNFKSVMGLSQQLLK